MLKQDSEIELATMAYQSMTDYARSVILDRSLVDSRDGMKPVQRRILYMTSMLHLSPKAKYMKLATLSGRVLALHPHGNKSVDDAAVNMSRQWMMNVPLIDIHGNNGSIDGSSAAASRYIEARQTPGAERLMKDLNKNAVDMMANYDNTLQEPKVLPASYPVAMVNGSSGIAIGMASSILPHNVLELLDASIELAKDNQLSNDKLFEIIKGPDFSTGGYLLDNGKIQQNLASGSGTYLIRAKVNRVANKKESYLDIVEIPFSVRTDKLVETMTLALEKYKALGVTEIRNDSTSNDDISIKVFCKKGTSEEQLMKIEKYLYKRSLLQISVSQNNNMIIKGRPRVLDIKTYLLNFIEFRLETLKRIWKFDLDDLTQKSEVARGLFRLTSEVDLKEKVIELAKSSKSKDDFIKSLKDDCTFTELQASTIAGMALYRLGKAGSDEFKAQFEKFENEMNIIKKHLTDSDDANTFLIKDLQATREVFKDKKRRTKIIEEDNLDDVADLKVTELIESKPAKVVLKDGLILHQMGKRAFDNQIEKPENNESVIASFDGLTTDYIVAVTKSGKTVTRLINDLDSINLDGHADGMNREIPDLNAKDEFIGGTIVDKTKKTSDKRVITISKHGYTKVIDPLKLLPNTNTKGYLKRVGSASSMKVSGDELFFAKTFTLKEMASTEVEFTLNDSSKASGVVHRKMDLSKFIERKPNGQGGSGFRGLNTKDGSLEIADYQIVDKSLNQSPTDVNEESSDEHNDEV